MSTNVNIKSYLTTLQRKPNEPNKVFASIEFDNYKDLGWTIQNISNACIDILFAKDNKMSLTNDLFDVIKLLEIQRQLIPHDEFELLDKLNE